MSDRCSGDDASPVKAGIDPLREAVRGFPSNNDQAASGGSGHAAQKTQSPRAEKTVRARSRIGQAGEKLRELAKRSSALSEKPALRLKKARDPFPPPALGLGATLSEDERDRLVEILDGENRPLLCMPPEIALRQKLPVRMVAVALRTRQNKLVLRKRRDVRLGFTGRWDLYAGFVRVGEAREDAALRLLLSDAGLDGLKVSPVPGREKREGVSSFFALFTADLPAGLYPACPAREMMVVDADELEGLLRDVPELFSPELTRAAAVPGLLRV